MTTPRSDWDRLARHRQVQRLVELAIEEDLGGGDITTEAIFGQGGDIAATAHIAARNATVCCALPLAQQIFTRFDPACRFEALACEGDPVLPGAQLCRIEADVRALLSAERLVLNFLMRLCGIAAQARAAVATIPQGLPARVYDTRKTSPGWRVLEKAAVRTGGAQNHRMGLFDAILIKDNHIAAAGSIATAIARARTHVDPGIEVEVEVDTLEQLDEALAAGAEIILLDNFDEQSLREAVAKNAGRAVLEASGGMTLERIAAVARTGVDRISLGSLTHTVQPADLGMDFT